MAHATVGRDFYMTAGVGSVSPSLKVALLKFNYQDGWTVYENVIPKSFVHGTFCMISYNVDKSYLPPETFTVAPMKQEPLGTYRVTP